MRDLQLGIHNGTGVFKSRLVRNWRGSMGRLLVVSGEGWSWPVLLELPMRGTEFKIRCTFDGA